MIFINCRWTPIFRNGLGLTYTEPVDVEGAVYDLFDAVGSKLRAVVRKGVVMVDLDRTTQPDPGDLLARVQSFIARVGPDRVDVSDLEDSSLYRSIDRPSEIRNRRAENAPTMAMMLGAPQAPISVRWGELHRKYECLEELGIDLQFVVEHEYLAPAEPKPVFIDS